MRIAGAAEPTASSGLFKAKPIVTLRNTNPIEVDVVGSGSKCEVDKRRSA
jgi:hypothetical protein